MEHSGRKIARRDFLKTTAAAVVSLAGKPMISAAMENYDLAVISGEPGPAVKKALEVLGGIGRFVKRGDRVILKPNMSFANPPEMGSTTHPDVVSSVAKICLEAGAKRVLVLDYTLRPAPLCLERTGIESACKAIKGVEVLAVEEKKFFREIKIPKGKVLDRVEVMEEVLESEVLINLPQAKSHSNTGVSLGIKNLMGLIWDRHSFHYKFNIGQGLADLSTVIKPHLTILDATRALVSGGPGGPGEVQKPRLVIAGVDPVAVDSFGVTVVPWYGQKFQGRQVEHLLLTHQQGVGKIDLEQLNIFKGSV
jgi:uncharacterized protein (DUF362 family)